MIIALKRDYDKESYVKEIVSYKKKIASKIRVQTLSFIFMSDL